MGRNRYKFFEPEILPPGYVSPGGAVKWTKPPTDAPLTTDDIKKTDEASKTVKWAEDRTAQTDYHFIGINTTTQAVTLTLPTATSISTGKILLVKDEAGNAGTNAITVVTSDGATIDGSPTIILDSDYASISVYYNGSEWSVY